MTYKEALDVLMNKIQIDVNFTEDFNRDYNCLTKCKEALEKQVPIKPLHKHKNYYCPNCDEDGWVMWDDAVPNEFDNYCSRCGQRLDFSDIINP